MFKRILLAFALVGAITACNSPGASSSPAGVPTTAPVTSPEASSPASPEGSSPASPEASPSMEEPSASPAAS
ncbi:MAG TPA: hypothetical protein VK697_04440 [Methylomirabilota bacterium]|jgi:hypothetical protein|nr:hypothetical protein [Methylomirabilota bacterium]